MAKDQTVGPISTLSNIFHIPLETFTINLFDLYMEINDDLKVLITLADIVQNNLRKGVS